MPPKKAKAPPATRIAFDGSIEQQCQKCQNWKPQLPDFKAARGNKIVDTCQGCRNDINAQYQVKKKNRNSVTREQDENAELVTSFIIVVDASIGEDVIIPSTPYRTDLPFSTTIVRAFDFMSVRTYMRGIKSLTNTVFSRKRSSSRRLY